MAAGSIWNSCGLSRTRQGKPVLVRRPWEATIFASFTASSNQHLDIDQYIRNIRVAAADDPALLDAWLHGRLDVDNAGAFFGSSFGIRRSLRDVRPGWIPQEELKRAFVCMDWGCALPRALRLMFAGPLWCTKGEHPSVG